MCHLGDYLGLETYFLYYSTRCHVYYSRYVHFLLFLCRAPSLSRLRHGPFFPLSEGPDPFFRAGSPFFCCHRSRTNLNLFPKGSRFSRPISTLARQKRGSPRPYDTSPKKASTFFPRHHFRKTILKKKQYSTREWISTGK